MKYLTKEWLNTELLSYTYSQIKISKKTEKYDEGYYQKLYKKICKLYIAAERGEELYQDPQEELRKIEESIAEPNITEEECAKRIRYKRDFISLNADRIKRGTYFKFDEKVVEQDFAVKIQQDIELYKKLPQEILCKIADLRVFALGYTSVEVKKLLKPYCAEQERISRRLRKIAQEETEKAEAHLSEDIGINDCTDTVILGIREKQEGIYIDVDLGGTLFVENGKIIEQELKEVYRWNPHIPNSGLSIILASELHYTNEKFELHFLIENVNEKNESQVGYLTLRGTDIKEIVTSEEV